MSQNLFARFVFLLAFSFFNIFFFHSSVNAANPKKYAAIVMDADTGEVLHEENCDDIRHPASLTKMMTLYMIFEAIKNGKLKMNTSISVSPHASRQMPSKLGLTPGETISVEAVVRGLITKSANDAAAAIAEHLGGTEEKFADMMTRKARQLGMRSTRFYNASGVPNPNQVTSARDMAILARALYRDFPTEYRLFRLTSFKHKGNVHRNHNHLLGKVQGLDGIKTGFIAASGFNLAASAVRQNGQGHQKRLITVVLGGENRHWRDRRVTELLESHFQQLGFPHNADKLTKTPAIISTVETIQEEAAPPSLDSLVQQVHYQENKKIKNAAVPTSPSGTWVAQVGTFTHQKDAQQITNKLKNIIKAGTISIEKQKKGRKNLFQAKFTGLSKAQAEKVCQLRKKAGADCLVISTSSKKPSPAQKNRKKGRRI